MPGDEQVLKIAGGNHPGEQKQDEVTLDVTANAFLSQATPVIFSYAGNSAPQPSPAWFTAMWLQEIPRIARDTGWLFRSGGFTTEPPADPLEVILAGEEARTSRSPRRARTRGCPRATRSPTPQR